MQAPIVRCVNGVFVVEPGPDFSHIYEPALEHLAVLKLLSKSVAPPRIVFDMQHVDLIGSALIGFLVSVSRTLTKRNGTFALANANKFCQTAINLAQLSTMLPNHDSVQSAIGLPASEF